MRTSIVDCSATNVPKSQAGAASEAVADLVGDTVDTLLSSYLSRITIGERTPYEVKERRKDKNAAARCFVSIPPVF
jgi:hypothetical protein